MVAGALSLALFGVCCEAVCAVVAAPDGVALVVPLIITVVPIHGN
jgi:hypothetical protein